MENKEYILNTAKQIITEEIEKAGYKVEAIYLFGSRARGDYKEYSDWDFFAVVDRDLLKKDILNILHNIRMKMVKNTGIAADIIVKSKDIYNHQKKDTGFLSFYVNDEGVSL
ncbi:MAG: nucleotidyltransferase domain-containing protein [bacterium]